MAFPLAPVNGQSYEEAVTGRRWSYSAASLGWIPQDITTLDDLDDVATLSNLTKGPLSIITTTIAGANPVNTDIHTTAGGAPRQSFSFANYTEVQDITVGLTYDVTGTSGLLRIDIYSGEDTSTDISTTNFPTVSAQLGSPVLSSYTIEAITATGAAVFTFPPNNILSPGIKYTFVIVKSNLDAAMQLVSRDSSIDGQFGNNTAKDIAFFTQGFELSGTPQTGDVLKFDTPGGSIWKAGSAYPTGAFDPIQIQSRDPVVTDVFNSGVFWRNQLTERVWISRGAGVWWPIDPKVPLSIGPTIAVRSDTAPLGKTDGFLWFSNVTATLYVYDADALAWIEV